MNTASTFQLQVTYFSSTNLLLSSHHHKLYASKLAVRVPPYETLGDVTIQVSINYINYLPIYTY